MLESRESGSLSPAPETTSRRKRSAVKLEIEDYSEEEHGSLSKRSKGLPSFPQQWNMKANAFPIPPSQYNPLDEPSPLGLQLRKSPSLLDLIQMRLSQGGDSTVGTTVVGSEKFKSDIKKESRASVASTSMDKLKASNFPAKHLKIGSWEYKSRYEGDLVAKCYFAKHKLVWEVLEGGLKSKIEIQWSDIMALKANCPDDGIGTLNIVLARQPLFFRETNPQPRKHTLWQATSDFTDGQASLHRQHFLECSQGLLNKHFEKLIQCDMRLNFLSRQPETCLDSPYFESRPSIFEDPGEIKTRVRVESGKRSTLLGFQDLTSPATAQSSSFETEKGDPGSVASEHVSREAPSPSSVMDTHAIEGNGMGKAVDSRQPRNWDEIKLPGLHPSMSMSDLMNHIGNRLSEQATFGNQLFSENTSEYHEILEDIAQYLLSDTQFTTTSDEKSVMSRVNSLCCLLQKDPSSVTNGESFFDDEDTNAKDVQLIHKLEATYNNTKSGGDTKPSEVEAAGDTRDVSTSKQQPTGMSRKDSYGELLLHLPRITSLPKFLFNIYEENDSHGR